MADYEFRYAPLTGRLTGKQMIEQTEQAINALASQVDSAAGQVEIISMLANEANENAATALETAEEALATTGRTYITVSTQTDANNYYDSQLIYIADSTSTNIPVTDTGMLEVKTNDNKTACEQVFIAASSGDAYYRHGAITAKTVGDVTTYSVTWSGWSSQPASQAYVQGELTNYLPLSGGTVTGGLTVEGTITGNLAGNADTATNATNAKNADTATNATNDANGDPIAGTYLPLSGGTLTGVVNGVTPPNGDNSKKLATTEFVNAKAGLPVGFQYFQTNPNVPAGSLPLLGGEYSRTTYADLWAWVQTQSGYLLEESAWQAKAAANGGNVPFYSKGDGSTTFRVPALKCWVKGTDGSTQLVGSYLEAGLPNITGGFDLRPVDGGQNVTWETNNGAIKVATQTGDKSNCVAGGSSQGPLMNVTIDASRSSSVYGNSTTVQPESIVGMWVVKAYGTVTNVGSTDVSAIAQGLTEAETRISTAAPTGVVQAFAGRATPQGWLLCDGSAVSRTDYAALYAVIGTTYGAGNGSTTFNLPNLVDKFVEGSATAGTVKSAGLPNITGGFDVCAGATGWSTVNDVYGAFQKAYNVLDHGNYNGGTSDNNYAGANFDASRSSSIYGNSTTVQPPALTMRYIIKY